MIQHITFKELEDKYKSGIVFLDCDGPLQDWVDHVTESLEDAGIIYKHEYGTGDWKRLETTDGRVDLFFNIFKSGAHVNEQKLPAWRVMFHGCHWLDIYKARYKEHHREK